MSPKGRMSRLGGLVVVGAMSAGLLAGCGERKSACGRGRQASHFDFFDAGW
ncbi:hypothetical protein PTQ21_29720 [Paenibacillus marchantiae]|uniref:hypothetical protein n=1 Tax=Paenibacillus marchantiae TaxID=3026433 RepID=UPI00237ADB09|nr:hypothetical protein [Paenibacillus marchantiae]WDQ32506.1 hypothetical protein PTQ21_29720 [Paenibacillus marchantiae]